MPSFASIRTPRLLALALLAGAAAPAPAAELYAATGFPYLLFGVAQPLNDAVTVRADWGTVGHHNYSGSTSDNSYAGTLNYNRFAAFGDWFVSGGSFRLTAGLTFNQGSTAMKAASKNNQITIGGTVYNYSGDVASTITLPSAAPYLGIGWGHAQTAAAGFSFHADLGASFGTPKATPLVAEGQVAQFVAPADLATENQRFQDGVGKYKALPQLTLGASYRF